MSSIQNNLNSVRKRILSACQKAGRNPSEIKLLAVSKKFPASIVQQAVDAGHLYFGENYVQEAKDKIAELDPKLTFDLIGPLQRNKAKLAVGLFDCIQSVDRIELAEEISKQAVKKKLTQKILIQVNISNEETKSGVLPDDLKELVERVGNLPSISLEGLMAIGRYYDVEDERCRKQCRDLRELRDSLPVDLSELSMGMSHDFEVAIEEGATIVRVGSAIFGERV